MFIYGALGKNRTFYSFLPRMCFTIEPQEQIKFVNNTAARLRGIKKCSPSPYIYSASAIRHVQFII